MIYLVPIFIVVAVLFVLIVVAKRRKSLQALEAAERYRSSPQYELDRQRSKKREEEQIERERTLWRQKEKLKREEEERRNPALLAARWLDMLEPLDVSELHKANSIR